MPNNKIIKDKENVEEYVENIKKILEEHPENVEIEPSDKNFYFQSYYGINEDCIIENLKEIKLSHYSHCIIANDPTFLGEELWVFGQVFKIDAHSYLDIYIKILIDESLLLCLSYHLQDYELSYPYT